MRLTGPRDVHAERGLEEAFGDLGIGEGLALVARRLLIS
jgi:hypothetical protein